MLRAVLLLGSVLSFILPAQGSPAHVKESFQKTLAVYVNELPNDAKNFQLAIVDPKEVSVAQVGWSPKGYQLKVSAKFAEAAEIDADGWQMILCHELSHLIAGAPFIWVNPDDGGELSAEGQADYFAAAKCLRRLWSDELANRVAVERIDFHTRQLIRNQGCPSDQCVRIVFSAYRTLLALNPSADLAIDQRSSEIAESTHERPEALPEQCRLDTMLAGALCPMDPATSFSRKNQRTGACLRDSADPFVRRGARPECWFQPADLDGYF